MKKVIVKTQDLKKYYQTGNQTVRALDGVNFEVAEREFVSIIGKSGSGKSTLLDKRLTCQCQWQRNIERY